MNTTSLLHALVLGDVMLDLHTQGRAERISPEAPIPVLRAEKEEARLGGAGAVAALLAALDIKPIIAGVIGDDPAGEVIVNLVASVGNALRGVPPAAHAALCSPLAPQAEPRSRLQSTSNELTDLARSRERGTPQRAFPTDSPPPRIVPGQLEDPTRISPPSAGGASGLQSILRLPDRPTTLKHRFLAKTQGPHAQPLLRVDRESCLPLTGQDEDDLLAAALSALELAQVVLIADYGKGVCTPKITSAVIRAAWKRKLPVLVDPRRGADYAIYRWATVIKPNRYEAGEATGREIRSSSDAFAAGKDLCRRWGFRAAVITLDADGLVLVTSEGHEQHFAPHRCEAIDVTGAGDTVLAVLGAALARGRTLADACQLATVAAGLQVERFGVSPVSWGEISVGGAVEGTGNRAQGKDCSLFNALCGVPLTLDLEPRAYSRHHAPRDGSLLARQASPCPLVSVSPCQSISLPALKQQLALHRSRGQRIIFTNGCFDLLHAGHLHCLTAAKALGDVLVVAVNSDASVRRLKGDSRPVVGQHDRAAMLAALACVDYVTIFDDDTPERLIAEIRPDVLVKGAASHPDGIPGAAFVASYGGRVELVPYMPDYSTTSLLARLRSPLAPQAEPALPRPSTSNHLEDPAQVAPASAHGVSGLLGPLAPAAANANPSPLCPMPCSLFPNPCSLIPNP